MGEPAGLPLLDPILPRTEGPGEPEQDREQRQEEAVPTVEHQTSWADTTEQTGPQGRRKPQYQPPRHQEQEAREERPQGFMTMSSN